MTAAATYCQAMSRSNAEVRHHNLVGQLCTKVLQQLKSCLMSIEPGSVSCKDAKPLLTRPAKTAAWFVPAQLLAAKPY
jgi:hypothetical protein